MLDSIADDDTDDVVAGSHSIGTTVGTTSGKTLLAEQGLIVDSSFRSRKQLIRSVDEASIVRNVIEARSLRDGLDHIQQGRIDACILGPTLTPQSATTFIDSASSTPRGQGCTYIAVVRKELCLSAEIVTDIVPGASAIVGFPYESTSFTRICRKAVAKGIEARGKQQPDFEDRHAELSALAALAESSPVVHQTLCGALQQSASGLRGISSALRNKDLCLSSDGSPSLATMDAIRLALEESFGSGTAARCPDSYDHFFISCLVQWFVDRTKFSHNEATSKLRRRLTGTLN